MSTVTGPTSGSSLFTGSSSYSTDFQNVIDRAVAIAGLPIDLLKAQQTSFTKQSTELDTLDTKISALQTALQAIQDAMGGAGMQTTASNTSVASVSVSDGAVEGAYSLQVTGIGSYATSLSAHRWTGTNDPSGDATTYQLVIGNQSFAITPANNSASAVAAAINAQYGNQVQATAVNIGQSDTPDYRISLRSATLGPQDLKIQTAAGSNLQWAQAPASGFALSQTGAAWDDSGTPSSYELSVDGTTYSISPTDNSAAAVAAAINAVGGNPVTATVVDLGAEDAHDYRIQLQSTSADAINVALRDAYGNSLQEQIAPHAGGSAVSQTAWSWDGTAAASGDTGYTLKIGGTEQTFTVSDNSASSVVASINSLGAGIQADLVDLGTAANPDYRIRLTNTAGGTDTPELLRDTALDLQKQGQPPGQVATYEVNGSGVAVTSKSRTIAIASGTAVTLTGAGTTDITVTRSTSVLSSALSDFADAYNAVFKQVEGQRGEGAGVLQGSSVLMEISRALSSVSTFSSEGSINGLTGLGLKLETNGTITYSPYTMMAADISNSAGITSFLGSRTGGGFLKAASGLLDTLENASTGLLKNAETLIAGQITRLNTKISEKQERVDAMQIKLQNQMAQMDSLIASMEQQYSYMSAMFSAMETSNQMYSK